MDKKLALGTSTFAFLFVTLGVALQPVAEMIGITSTIASAVGFYVFATPAALLAGLRIGRITHASALLVSAVATLLALSVIVAVLNAIAAPMGGHFGWSNLFSPPNLPNILPGVVATIAAPQAWLWLLNRRGTGLSGKPSLLHEST